MHEQPGALEDSDMHKVTQLNTAGPWTHFWAPSNFCFSSQLFYFPIVYLFLSALGSEGCTAMTHQSQRTDRTITGGLTLPFHVEYSLWMTLMKYQKVRNVTLVGRQQPQPGNPVWSDIWLLFRCWSHINLKPLLLKNNDNTILVPYCILFQIPYSSFSRKTWFFSQLTLALKSSASINLNILFCSSKANDLFTKRKWNL